MLNSEPSFVNPVATLNRGMFVGVAKKPQNQGRRMAANIAKLPKLLQQALAPLGPV
jgi:hypothetical protein